MNQYVPDKWQWTAADFEQMGWHDVHIHGIAFAAYALSFDIDYMFHWVKPAPGETYYKFWLSPSTVLFENVNDVQLSLEAHGKPIILGVTRSESVAAAGQATTWLWRLDCLDGEISFRATGYRQFTRRAPVLASAQVFSEEERGGISFAHVTPESTAG